MRKYINGKIIEMTEKDIAKAKTRTSKNHEYRTNASNYEKRIKELEEMVTTLSSKLSNADN